MFKLLIEFSFAKWFFSEAQIERFSTGMHQRAGDTIWKWKQEFINPLIQQMLAYGESHPDYMTPEQKTELQTILNDNTGITLARDYTNSQSLYYLSHGDAGNNDTITKNILMSLAKNKFDAHPTLTDFLKYANERKRSHRGVEHSQGGVNPIKTLAGLFNWLVIDKVKFNQEKGLKGKGGAAKGSDKDGPKGAEASTPSNVDDAIDRGQFDDDDNAEMNQLKGNLENKLDDCLRSYQAGKSAKYIQEAEEIYKKVESQAERGSGKIPWKDFGDIKKYSLLSLLGKFIKTASTGPNSRGLDKDSFDKFKLAEKGALTSIINSENFKQFVADQLNGAQPSADARLLVASTVVPACLMAIANRGPDQKIAPIVEQYKAIPFVSNSPEAMNLLNLCADMTINQQMKGKASTAKGAVSPTEVGGAVFDIDYPVTDINYQIERDFLDFQERYRTIIGSGGNNAVYKTATYLGKDEEGQPVYLDLKGSCQKMLADFAKFGHFGKVDNL